MAAECEVDQCGVLAVGRCHCCRRAFCRSHQAIGSDAEFPATFRMLLVDRCASCESQLVTAKHTAATQERERSRASLASISDPLERVVTAIGRFGSVYQGPYEGAKRTVSIQREELREVIKAIWPAWNMNDINHNPPWDGAEVARWFALRAQNAGVGPDASAQWVTWPRGLLGKQKRQTGPAEPAWRFPQGSTVFYGDEPNVDAFVFMDGRFMPSAANHPSPDSYHARGNLSAVALADMAQLLGLA